MRTFPNKKITPLKFLRLKIPFGEIRIAATKKGIYRVCILSNSSPRSNVRDRSSFDSSSKDLGNARDLLSKYFQGRRVSFCSLKIDDSGLSRFEKRVLMRLRKKGWGKVMSYRSLAAWSGHPRACRAVGSVLRKNRLPIILPCHRVVCSDGRIGQYAYGIHFKKKLLILEGVTIRRNRVTGSGFRN